MSSPVQIIQNQTWTEDKTFNSLIEIKIGAVVTIANGITIKFKKTNAQNDPNLQYGIIVEQGAAIQFEPPSGDHTEKTTGSDTIIMSDNNAPFIGILIFGTTISSENRLSLYSRTKAESVNKKYLENIVGETNFSRVDGFFNTYNNNIEDKESKIQYVNILAEGSIYLIGTPKIELHDIKMNHNLILLECLFNDSDEQFRDIVIQNGGIQSYSCNSLKFENLYMKFRFELLKLQFAYSYLKKQKDLLELTIPSENTRIVPLTEFTGKKIQILFEFDPDDANFKSDIMLRNFKLGSSIIDADYDQSKTNLYLVNQDDESFDALTQFYTNIEDITDQNPLLKHEGKFNKLQGGSTKSGNTGTAFKTNPNDSYYYFEASSSSTEFTSIGFLLLPEITVPEITNSDDLTFSFEYKLNYTGDAQTNVLKCHILEKEYANFPHIHAVKCVNTPVVDISYMHLDALENSENFGLKNELISAEYAIEQDDDNDKIIEESKFEISELTYQNIKPDFKKYNNIHQVQILDKTFAASNNYTRVFKINNASLTQGSALNIAIADFEGDPKFGQERSIHEFLNMQDVSIVVNRTAPIINDNRILAVLEKVPGKNELDFLIPYDNDTKQKIDYLSPLNVKSNKSIFNNEAKSWNCINLFFRVLKKEINNSLTDNKTYEKLFKFFLSKLSLSDTNLNTDLKRINHLFALELKKSEYNNLKNQSLGNNTYNRILKNTLLYLEHFPPILTSSTFFNDKTEQSKYYNENLPQKGTHQLDALRHIYKLSSNNSQTNNIGSGNSLVYLLWEMYAILKIRTHTNNFNFDNDIKIIENLEIILSQDIELFVRILAPIRDRERLKYLYEYIYLIKEIFNSTVYYFPTIFGYDVEFGLHVIIAYLSLLALDYFDIDFLVHLYEYEKSLLPQSHQNGMDKEMAKRFALFIDEYVHEKKPDFTPEDSNHVYEIDVDDHISNGQQTFKFTGSGTVFIGKVAVNTLVLFKNFKYKFRNKSNDFFIIVGDKETNAELNHNMFEHLSLDNETYQVRDTSNQLIDKNYTQITKVDLSSTVDIKYFFLYSSTKNVHIKVKIVESDLKEFLKNQYDPNLHHNTFLEQTLVGQSGTKYSFRPRIVKSTKDPIETNLIAPEYIDNEDNVDLENTSWEAYLENAQNKIIFFKFREDSIPLLLNFLEDFRMQSINDLTYQVSLSEHPDTDVAGLTRSFEIRENAFMDISFNAVINATIVSSNIVLYNLFSTSESNYNYVYPSFLKSKIPKLSDYDTNNVLSGTFTFEGSNVTNIDVYYIIQQLGSTLPTDVITPLHKDGDNFYMYMAEPKEDPTSADTYTKILVLCQGDDNLETSNNNSFSSYFSISAVDYSTKFAKSIFLDSFDNEFILNYMEQSPRICFVVDVTEKDSSNNAVKFKNMFFEKYQSSDMDVPDVLFVTEKLVFKAYMKSENNGPKIYYKNDNTFDFITLYPLRVMHDIEENNSIKILKIHDEFQSIFAEGNAETYSSFTKIISDEFLTSDFTEDLTDGVEINENAIINTLSTTKTLNDSTFSVKSQLSEFGLNFNFEPDSFEGFSTFLENTYMNLDNEIIIKISSFLQGLELDDYPNAETLKTYILQDETKLIYINITVHPVEKKVHKDYDVDSMWTFEDNIQIETNFKFTDKSEIYSHFRKAYNDGKINIHFDTYAFQIDNSLNSVSRKFINNIYTQSLTFVDVLDKLNNDLEDLNFIDSVDVINNKIELKDIYYDIMQYSQDDFLDSFNTFLHHITQTIVYSYLGVNIDETSITNDGSEIYKKIISTKDNLSFPFKFTLKKLNTSLDSLQYYEEYNSNFYTYSTEKAMTVKSGSRHDYIYSISNKNVVQTKPINIIKTAPVVQKLKDVVNTSLMSVLSDTQIKTSFFLSYKDLNVSSPELFIIFSSSITISSTTYIISCKFIISSSLQLVTNTESSKFYFIDENNNKLEKLFSTTSSDIDRNNVFRIQFSFEHEQKNVVGYVQLNDFNEPSMLSFVNNSTIKKFTYSIDGNEEIDVQSNMKYNFFVNKKYFDLKVHDFAYLNEHNYDNLSYELSSLSQHLKKQFKVTFHKNDEEDVIQRLELDVMNPLQSKVLELNGENTEETFVLLNYENEFELWDKCFVSELVFPDFIFHVNYAQLHREFISKERAFIPIKCKKVFENTENMIYHALLFFNETNLKILIYQLSTSDVNSEQFQLFKTYPFYNCDAESFVNNQASEIQYFNENTLQLLTFHSNPTHDIFDTFSMEIVCHSRTFNTQYILLFFQEDAENIYSPKACILNREKIAVESVTIEIDTESTTVTMSINSNIFVKITTGSTRERMMNYLAQNVLPTSSIIMSIGDDLQTVTKFYVQNNNDSNVSNTIFLFQNYLTIIHADFIDNDLTLEVDDNTINIENEYIELGSYNLSINKTIYISFENAPETSQDLIFYNNINLLFTSSETLSETFNLYIDDVNQSMDSLYINIESFNINEEEFVILNDNSNSATLMKYLIYLGKVDSNNTFQRHDNINPLEIYVLYVNVPDNDAILAELPYILEYQNETIKKSDFSKLQLNFSVPSLNDYNLMQTFQTEKLALENQIDIKTNNNQVTLTFLDFQKVVDIFTFSIKSNNKGIKYVDTDKQNLQINDEDYLSLHGTFIPFNKNGLLTILDMPDVNYNQIITTFVTDMSELFYNREFDNSQNLNSWDFSNVTNFQFMFKHSNYTGTKIVAKDFFTNYYSNRNYKILNESISSIILYNIQSNSTLKVSQNLIEQFFDNKQQESFSTEDQQDLNKEYKENILAQKDENNEILLFQFEQYYHVNELNTIFQNNNDTSSSDFQAVEEYLNITITKKFSFNYFYGIPRLCISDANDYKIDIYFSFVSEKLETYVHPGSENSNTRHIIHIPIDINDNGVQNVVFKNSMSSFHIQVNDKTFNLDISASISYLTLEHNNTYPSSVIEIEGDNFIYDTENPLKYNLIENSFLYLFSPFNKNSFIVDLQTGKEENTCSFEFIYLFNLPFSMTFHKDSDNYLIFNFYQDTNLNNLIIRKHDDKDEFQIYSNSKHELKFEFQIKNDLLSITLTNQDQTKTFNIRRNAIVDSFNIEKISSPIFFKDLVFQAGSKRQIYKYEEYNNFKDNEKLILRNDTHVLQKEESETLYNYTITEKTSKKKFKGLTAIDAASSLNLQTAQTTDNHLKTEHVQCFPLIKDITIIKSRDQESKEFLHLFKKGNNLFHFTFDNYTLHQAVEEYFNQNELSSDKYGDISEWDVSQVTNMSSLFSGKDLSNVDLSLWDVSRTVNMENMFKNATSIDDINISNWKVQNVRNMKGMFESCTRIPDISRWKTSRVLYMQFMFQHANLFAPLDAWDTSSVQNMEGMFSNCILSNNVDLSSWDVSSVQNMREMFLNAAFSFNVSSWNVQNVLNFESMFQGVKDNFFNLRSWVVDSYAYVENMFLDSSMNELYFYNGDGKQVTSTPIINEFFNKPKIRLPSKFSTLDDLKDAISNYSHNAFSNKSYEQYGDISTWDVSAITDMSYLFSDKQNFTPHVLQGIRNWDVSNVENMNFMFMNTNFLSTQSIDFNLNSWDVSNVTTMESMFENSFLNLDISQWDVSSVQNMRRMFYNSSFNIDIYQWNVQSVTTFESMFELNNEFNQNMRGWPVSQGANITNMFHMLYNTKEFESPGTLNGSEYTVNKKSLATSGNDINVYFNQYYSFDDLVDLQTAVSAFIDEDPNAKIKYGPSKMWKLGQNLTSLDNLFQFKVNGNNSEYKLDIDHWNTENITSMARTFLNYTGFSHDISRWNVSNVRNMESMFEGCDINNDLSAWQTSKVFNMRSMFKNAKEFNSSIGTWDVSSVQDFSLMFYNAENFSADIRFWEVQIQSFSIPIPFLFSSTDNHYSEYEENTNHFFNQFSYQFKNKDELKQAISGQIITSTRNYPSNDYGDIKYWDVSNITDMSNLFELEFDDLEFDKINLENIEFWDVSNVTSMENMFLNLKQQNVEGVVNLSKWDVSNVTSMANMFENSDILGTSSGISTWDVSNVQNMSNMFKNANSFSEDLKDWNVSKVINMSSMFENATEFESDLSQWNVSKVTNMSSMFKLATSFNSDLGQWDIHRLRDIQFMFDGASAFNNNIDHINSNNFVESFVHWDMYNLDENTFVNVFKNTEFQGLEKAILELKTQAKLTTDAAHKFVQSILSSPSKTFFLFFKDSNDNFHEIELDYFTKAILHHTQMSQSNVIETVSSFTIDDNTVSLAIINPESTEATKSLFLNPMPQTHKNLLGAFIGSKYTKDGQNYIDFYHHKHDLSFASEFIFQYGYSNAQFTSFQAVSKPNIFHSFKSSQMNHIFKYTLPNNTVSLDIIVNNSNSLEDVFVNFDSELFDIRYHLVNKHMFTISLKDASKEDVPLELYVSRIKKMTEHLHNDSKEIYICSSEIRNVNTTQLNRNLLKSLESAEKESLNELINSNSDNYTIELYTNSTFILPPLNSGDDRNITGMFYNATEFNGSISNWDISNITSLDHLFYGATNFNSSLKSWNVSNITSAKSMFENATLFQEDLSSWSIGDISDFAPHSPDHLLPAAYTDLTQKTTVLSLHSNGKTIQFSGNTNIFEHVQVVVVKFHPTSDNAEDLELFYIVRDKTALRTLIQQYPEIPLTNIVTTLVGDMSSLFYEFKRDESLESWDTSNVSNMSFMFAGSLFTDPGLTYWDVSSVKSFESMFSSAVDFNGELFDLNTNAHDFMVIMKNMFSDATAFQDINGKLSAWNVDQVIDMENAFKGTTLTTDLSSWNVRIISNKTLINASNISKYLGFAPEQENLPVSAKIQQRHEIIPLKSAFMENLPLNILSVQYTNVYDLSEYTTLDILVCDAEGIQQKKIETESIDTEEDLMFALSNLDLDGVSFHRILDKRTSNNSTGMNLFVLHPRNYILKLAVRNNDSQFSILDPLPADDSVCTILKAAVSYKKKGIVLSLDMNPFIEKSACQLSLDEDGTVTKNIVVLDTKKNEVTVNIIQDYDLDTSLSFISHNPEFKTLDVDNYNSSIVLDGDTTIEGTFGITKHASEYIYTLSTGNINILFEWSLKPLLLTFGDEVQIIENNEPVDEHTETPADFEETIYSLDNDEYKMKSFNSENLQLASVQELLFAALPDTFVFTTSLKNDIMDLLPANTGSVNIILYFESSFKVFTFDKSTLTLTNEIKNSSFKTYLESYFTSTAESPPLSFHKNFYVLYKHDVWKSWGPRNTINGASENVVPDNKVAGAIETVWCDPSDSNIIVIGAVNGGIWKTINADTNDLNDITWQPKTDELDLSITEIKGDILDNSANVLCAVCGLCSSYGRIGNISKYMYISNDKGETWEQKLINAYPGQNYYYDLNSVVMWGDYILIGSHYEGIHPHYAMENIEELGPPGLYLSSDKGENWQHLNILSPTLDFPVTSLEICQDQANEKTYLFAGMLGHGIFRSEDNGGTWQKLTIDTSLSFFNVPLDNNGIVKNNNILLSASKDHQNVMYAIFTEDGIPKWMGYTTDFGNSWNRMDNPSTFDESGNVHYLNPTTNKNGTPRALKHGAQGQIHLSLFAHPKIADIVFAGGDRQPELNGPIGNSKWSGRLFRGNRNNSYQPKANFESTSTSYSHQWSIITNNVPSQVEGVDYGGLTRGGTGNNSAPHADSRAMTMDAKGRLIEVNDGGVYRLTTSFDNPEDQNAVWESLCSNLSVFEVHSIAYDPKHEFVIVGSQDNGTIVSTPDISKMIFGGDGGDVQCGTLSNQSESIIYTSSQYGGNLKYVSVNNFSNLEDYEFDTFEYFPDEFSGRLKFVPVTAINIVDPSLFIAATDESLIKIVRYNKFEKDIANVIFEIESLNNEFPIKLLYGHKNDRSGIFFLTTGRRYIIHSQNKKKIYDLPAPYKDTISFDYNPDNMYEVYIIEGTEYNQTLLDTNKNHLLIYSLGQTTNTIKFAEEIKIPYPGSRCIKFHKNKLYIGCSKGVYTYDLKKKEWNEHYNETLPNTIIQDMIIHGNTLFVATVGRGVFSISL